MTTQVRPPDLPEAAPARMRSCSKHDERHCVRFRMKDRSGRAAPVHKPPSPRPGPLSIKLFVPYCDAICDSPRGTRQFERVTS